MTPLRELCRVIRSKNAGPFIFTFDIMFRDAEAFGLAKAAGHLDRAAVARAYGISPNEVLSPSTTASSLNASRTASMRAAAR